MLVFLGEIGSLLGLAMAHGSQGAKLHPLMPDVSAAGAGGGGRGAIPTTSVIDVLQRSKGSLVC